jgi:hypothetical protein
MLEAVWFTPTRKRTTISNGCGSKARGIHHFKDSRRKRLNNSDRLGELKTDCLGQLKPTINGARSRVRTSEAVYLRNVNQRIASWRIRVLAFAVRPSSISGKLAVSALRKIRPSTFLIAPQNERFSSLQVRIALNANFQVSGSVVSNLSYVAGKLSFKWH